MKTTTLALVAAMAAGTLVHAQEAVQWRVEDGGNGHWYALNSTAATWLSHQQNASTLGAHLATLTSDAEDGWVRGTLGPVGGWLVYVGLYQDPESPDFSEPDGGWRWVTAEPVTWMNWCPDEPNNLKSPAGPQNVTQTTASQGACLDDTHGVAAGRAWIEWSADCNGDGVVDYGQILDGTLEDANGNGVPDCCDDGVSCDPCVGDVNFDGIVNGADISVLLGFWGLNGKPNNADTNDDGQVDGADLANVLGNWGTCQ